MIQSGSYTDSQSDYQCNEVALDYNAGLVGAAAALYLVHKKSSSASSSLMTSSDIKKVSLRFNYGLGLANTSIKSAKNNKKKTITVKWTKKSSAEGYQLQYSTNKKFKSKKTVQINGNSTTSTKLTKLKKKKTYYIRIRTYKTVDGKKQYSGWSAKKKVKIKK